MLPLSTVQIRVKYEAILTIVFKQDYPVGRDSTARCRCQVYSVGFRDILVAARFAKPFLEMLQRIFIYFGQHKLPFITCLVIRASLLLRAGRNLDQRQFHLVSGMRRMGLHTYGNQNLELFEIDYYPLVRRYCYIEEV